MKKRLVSGRMESTGQPVFGSWEFMYSRWQRLSFLRGLAWRSVWGSAGLQVRLGFVWDTIAC